MTILYWLFKAMVADVVEAFLPRRKVLVFRKPKLVVKTEQELIEDVVAEAVRRGAYRALPLRQSAPN